MMATEKEILEDLRQGRMIVLLDDEDRENEGDLVMAAEFATPEAVNFMARQACGLICAAMEEGWGGRLGLRIAGEEGPRPSILQKGGLQPSLQKGGLQPSLHGTRFAQSLDYIHGTTTGISAADRSAGLMALADPATRPEDFATPGHLFPLLAHPGGLGSRRGHTEGSVELCRRAGLSPVAVICEIIKEDGTMARLPDLEVFARKWNLKMTTMERLVKKESVCV